MIHVFRRRVPLKHPHIIFLMIYMKNYAILIGWEQCSSSVTQVQQVKHQCKLHIVKIMIGWKTVGNFWRQWYYLTWWRKFRAETLKNVFSNEKNGFKKGLPALPPRKFFHFILLISNHTVFLVQFGINLHLWVFQKAHSCKLIPNWTRNRMITYTKHIPPTNWYK